MSTLSGKTFSKGDRVVVTDLRTGISHPGAVVKGSVPNSTYINVKYDTGQTVRVGTGFVRSEV